MLSIGNNAAEYFAAASITCMHNLIPNYNFYCRNIQSNPFVCNCHLAWFAEWLRKKQLTEAHAKCSAPLSVKDSLLYELPSSQFKCSGTERLILVFLMINKKFLLFIFLKILINERKLKLSVCHV